MTVITAYSLTDFWTLGYWPGGYWPWITI